LKTEGRTLIAIIDGGGLQALASLSILNNICEAIAENNGTRERPSPYQLFDIIGGIGTGG
jgi:patatin-like phospholipase/acyl hydrolase